MQKTGKNASVYKFHQGKGTQQKAYYTNNCDEKNTVS